MLEAPADAIYKQAVIQSDIYTCAGSAHTCVSWQSIASDSQGIMHTNFLFSGL